MLPPCQCRPPCQFFGERPLATCLPPYWRASPTPCPDAAPPGAEYPPARAARPTGALASGARRRHSKRVRAADGVGPQLPSDAGAAGRRTASRAGPLGLGPDAEAGPGPRAQRWRCPRKAGLAGALGRSGRGVPKRGAPGWGAGRCKISGALRVKTDLSVRGFEPAISSVLGFALRNCTSRQLLKNMEQDIYKHIYACYIYKHIYACSCEGIWSAHGHIHSEVRHRLAPATTEKPV